MVGFALGPGGPAPQGPAAGEVSFLDSTALGGALPSAQAPGTLGQRTDLYCLCPEWAWVCPALAPFLKAPPIALSVCPEGASTRFNSTVEQAGAWAQQAIRQGQPCSPSGLVWGGEQKIE